MSDSPELTAAIPWAGRRLQGAAGYKELTGQFFGKYEPLEFDARRFHDAGEVVFAEGHFRFRHRGTGRIAEAEFAMRFDMRDGRISGGQIYKNTYGVAAARKPEVGAPGGAATVGRPRGTAAAVAIIVGGGLPASWAPAGRRPGAGSRSDSASRKTAPRLPPVWAPTRARSGSARLSRPLTWWRSRCLGQPTRTPSPPWGRPRWQARSSWTAPARSGGPTRAARPPNWTASLCRARNGSRPGPGRRPGSCSPSTSPGWRFWRVQASRRGAPRSSFAAAIRRPRPWPPSLASDLGFDACDAGPLRMARYLEPLAMVWIDMSRNQGRGTDFALRVMQRRAGLAPSSGPDAP